MRTRFLLVFVIAAQLVLGASAWETSRATSPQDEQQAEEWVTMALAAYKAKRFLDAAQAFENAHRLSPNPRLVWNIARCYEDGKQWQSAKLWFKKFLAKAKPGSKNSAEATRRLAGVEAKLKAVAQAEEARRSEEARNAQLAAKRAEERRKAAKAEEARRKAQQERMAKINADLQRKIDENNRMAKENRALAEKLRKEAELRRKRAQEDAANLGLLVNPLNFGQPQAKSDTSMTTGGIVSLVLGAAVGGVGAFLFVNAESLRQDWRDAVENANGGVVSELTRSEAIELQDSANLQQTLGVTAISVGGATFLTGIILLAVGDPEPETTLSTRVADGGFSVHLRSRF